MKILIACSDSKAKAIKKVVAGMGAEILSEGESIGSPSTPVKTEDVIDPKLESFIKEMKDKIDLAVSENDTLKEEIEALKTEKLELEAKLLSLDTHKEETVISETPTEKPKGKSTKKK